MSDADCKRYRPGLALSRYNLEKMRDLAYPRLCSRQLAAVSYGAQITKTRVTRCLATSEMSNQIRSRSIFVVNNKKAGIQTRQPHDFRVRPEVRTGPGQWNIRLVASRRPSGVYGLLGISIRNGPQLWLATWFGECFFSDFMTAAWLER